MGTRWCAPKKNNNRAWKRIERGEYMWDRRKVRRHAIGFLPTDAAGRTKLAHRWRISRRQNSKNGAKVDLGG